MMMPVPYFCAPSEMGEIPGPSDSDYQVTGETILTSSTTMINEITDIRFDPYQEILWCGSSSGKIQSYFGPELNNYTSFVVSDSPIRALNIAEDAVVVVTKDTVMGFKRQGIALFENSSNNFEDLTCICSLPIAPSSTILGGRQQKIVQMDLVTQKEQRLVYLKEGDCLSIRANDRYLFNSDSSGMLTMRSQDSIEPIHTVVAHSSGISDFDISENKIITCGYTLRPGSREPFCDPFLKVFDTRNLKTLVPHSILFPPVLCRFASPFTDERTIVASKYGHIVEADLYTPKTKVLYQSCTRDSFSCMDVSSSFQCCAMGDTNGLVLMFGDRENAIFNLESWPTIFPTVEECLPLMPIDSINSTLSCIPTPLPSAEGYCSDFWPEDSIRKEFRLNFHAKNTCGSSFKKIFLSLIKLINKLTMYVKRFYKLKISIKIETYVYNTYMRNCPNMTL